MKIRASGPNFHFNFLVWGPVAWIGLDWMAVGLDWMGLDGVHPPTIDENRQILYRRLLGAPQPRSGIGSKPLPAQESPRSGIGSPGLASVRNAPPHYISGHSMLRLVACSADHPPLWWFY